MNPVQKTPVSRAPATRPANDNRTPANQEISDLLRELIPLDDAAADALCRRGERLANAVVVVMATCLVVISLLCGVLIYTRVLVAM